MPTCSSLSVSLPSGRVLGSLDVDAKSYINTIVAAGATVTSVQKKAINTFILSEKAASRWSSYKRFFFPVWGIAAANAVDIITRASGTFNGTVTHSSGYIKGNGTTGYFDTGISNSGVGMTVNGGSVSVLIYTADTRTDSREYIGATDGANRRGNILQTSGTVVSSHIYNAGAAAVLDPTTRNGIFTGTVLSSTSRYIQRRSQSGIQYNTQTASDTTTACPNNTFVCARNNSGTASLNSDAAIGAAIMSLGFTNTANEAFTANLKTLWETCTGLTLP